LNFFFFFLFALIFESNQKQKQKQKTKQKKQKAALAYIALHPQSQRTTLQQVVTTKLSFSARSVI